MRLAQRVAYRFLKMGGDGSATALAKRHWARLRPADRFEWLVGYFGDKAGGKTFAAAEEDTRELQSIVNRAGEEWGWRHAEEFAEAVDEEAKELETGGTRPTEETPTWDLETVLTEYVADSRMLDSRKVIFLRDAIEKSRVAPGVRVLERIQSDLPDWTQGSHVKFSVASFSSVEFSKGRSAGNIDWKSTDRCIVRVENPRRGLTIGYANRGMDKMQFDAGAERETLLTGSYVVTQVESIVEPYTNPDYGYRVPMFHLRET